MLLRTARIRELRGRRLSAIDSTVIALAKRMNAPILSGDKDLMYVAEHENVKVIW